MLKQRIITAAILAPLVIAGIIFLPLNMFAFFVLVVISIAAWEWAGMSGLTGCLAVCFTAFVASICFILYFLGQNAQQIALYIGTFFWVIALALVVSFPKTNFLWSKSWQRAVMGIIILVPAWVGIVWLKSYQGDGLFVLLLLVIIWSADIGAYFSGKAWGKNKLAPAVSPGKSWEGVFGGLILAIVMAVIYAITFSIVSDAKSISWVAFLSLVLITAMISVLGDLTESMVKRQQGLKDSSNLLPGHGGVMDRIDSLVAVAPLFSLWFAQTLVN